MSYIIFLLNNATLEKRFKNLFDNFNSKTIVSLKLIGHLFLGQQQIFANRGMKVVVTTEMHIYWTNYAVSPQEQYSDGACD